MKIIQITSLLLCLGLFNCSDSDDDDLTEEKGTNFKLAATEEDLPECNEDLKDFIYYLSSTKTLKQCNGSTFVEIELRKDEPKPSFVTIDNKDALPDCNEVTKDISYFSKEEKTLFSCSGTEYQEVVLHGEKGDDGAMGATGPAGPQGEKGEIGAKGSAGADGLKISTFWRYHKDEYATAQNISSECSSLVVYIATVSLSMMTDGSAFVSLAGSEGKIDNGSDVYDEDFSHSFLLPPQETEQEKIIKISYFANARIRYHITLSDTPVFKAVVDCDGSFDDNTDISFTLTKVVE